MRIQSDINFNDFEVSHYPLSDRPFVTVGMGRSGIDTATLYLHSVTDCDKLIKAAVQAKSLLLGETSEPVADLSAQPAARTCGHTRTGYGACEKEPIHPGWHRNMTGEEWPKYADDPDLDAILNGPGYRLPAIELTGGSDAR